MGSDHDATINDETIMGWLGDHPTPAFRGSFGQLKTTLVLDPSAMPPIASTPRL